jgi:hypothetical protein
METATSCVADCGVGSLQVINSSTYTVNALYISPCGSSPVTNVLTGTLPPNYNVTVPNLPIGCYDLRAQNSTSIYWTRASTMIASGAPFVWTLSN